MKEGVWQFSSVRAVARKTYKVSELPRTDTYWYEENY